MSSVGSFGTFTTARLAIYVSQKGLSVTGNNIANINTVGYTRQRLDQISFKTGASDRYQSASDMRVGNGALAQSVSQLRDPYLDIRYRAEHSSEGYYNGRLSGLDQVAAILDEIGKGEKDGDGLLYAQFRDFFSALQHIQVGAGTQVNDTLASTSAEALCQLFYNAASQLERLHNNTEIQLRQELDSINGTLVSIRKLNEAIQQAEIYGDKALELRDERNNLIDSLSEKLKINATYSMVDIGGKQVEQLTIRLDNANPDKDVTSDSSLLVNGNYCAQLTTPKANDAYNALYDASSEVYAAAKKLLEANDKKDPADPTWLDKVKVTDGLGNEVEFASAKELDDALVAAAKDPDKQLLQYRYLDENGEGTNDPRDAAQVFDDDYNITVSDLRDKMGKAWEDFPDVRDILVKDTTGFPERAKLTGNFQITGGEWKDGDKINITVGGKDYSIEVGKEVSADAANKDPKNISNAIRQALLKDPDLAKDYDISTRTTRIANGFNVDLTVKAKEPEKKAVQPDISISTPAGGNVTPAGSFTIGTPTLVANSNPPKYTAKVATGDKFNNGDTITFGTAPNQTTLVVGKGISVNKANNAEQLAAKLAGILGSAEFKVTAKGDELTFTAASDAVTTQPQIPALQFDPAKPAEINPPLGNIKWYEGRDIGNDANGQPVNLKPDPEIVDNGDNTTAKVTTRYYLDDNDNWHQVIKTVTTSKDKVLDDNDLFGKLQAVRELLSEEGEFASQADIDRDESAAIKRGIPYYQEVLDLLARQFAATMNEANNGFAVDENGTFLTSKDGGKTFEDLLVAGEPLSKAGMTDAQKAEVEADSLGNYIKANFAGFVKDADGNDTEVLADKYGNPLKLGGTELTTKNVQINGATLEEAGFAGINEDGKFVDDTGAVISDDLTDPDNPVPYETKFTDTAFGDPADTKAEEAATADLNKKALDSYLAANGGYKMGGNLFSNRGDTDDCSGITALNISVSQSWNKGDVHVVPTYIKLFKGETSNTTQQDNALHMGSLMDKDLIYNPQDLMGDALSSYLFQGSFQELFEKMSTTLGNDQDKTEVSLMTHVGQALDIDTSRDSVSAVDLNDEAMDLMQYTHSLNAAYRLMTTIDEMLERLITGTGVTR